MKVKFNVVVIGAGGTGSYFIKEFARYMAYNIELDFQRMIHMCVVDGDVLEKKNLERQAYCEEDIGEYKAVVLVDAIKGIFPHIEVDAIPHYVLKSNDIAEIFFDMNHSSYNNSVSKVKVFNILIGACDNNRCRQVMHQWFLNERNCIYIDSGNGYSNGQIVVGIRDEGKTVAADACMCFPNMLLDDSPDVTQKSCTEMNDQEPQHIVTNMMAGNLLLTHVCSIMMGKACPGITYFDAFNFMTKFIQAKDISIEDYNAESADEDKGYENEKTSR